MKTTIEDIIETARQRGRMEALRAGVKMFMSLDLPAEALAVGMMNIDAYLAMANDDNLEVAATNVVAFHAGV